jgi:ABC-type branched-subunit amino acid transport system ATPase component
VRALARLADRFVVLQKGSVAWQGTGAALLSDEALLHGMLGV